MRVYMEMFTLDNSNSQNHLIDATEKTKHWRAKQLSIAEVLDSYRTIPRILLVSYGYMLYYTTEWFMALPDPSGSQSAFISTVWAASAAWSGFYLNSGRKWT
jgi:hypothetical protein